eukprot:292030-Amphidinium_carterae.1
MHHVECYLVRTGVVSSMQGICLLFQGVEKVFIVFVHKVLYRNHSEMTLQSDQRLLRTSLRSTKSIKTRSFENVIWHKFCSYCKFGTYSAGTRTTAIVSFQTFASKSSDCHFATYGLSSFAEFIDRKNPKCEARVNKAGCCWTVAVALQHERADNKKQT